MKTDFSRVMDALPGLVWTMNADDGIDYVNNRWLEYTGRTLERLRQEGLESVIHPADIAMFQSTFRSAHEAAGQGEIEVRLQRADGEYRWFLLRFAPMDDGENRWCGIASFADEARSDTIHGSASEQRLRRFIKNIPVHMVFLDPRCEVEYVNDHGFAYYGQSFEDLTKWRTTQVVHPDDIGPGLQMLGEMLAGGPPYVNQGRLLGKDGLYRWFQSIIVPSTDAAGNVVRYVSIRNDIDDLKKAEHLLTGEVELLRMVAQGRVLGEVLDALCKVVEEISPGSICSVLGVDSDALCFRPGAGPSLPDSYNRLFDGKAIDPGYGPCSLAAMSNTPIITSNPLTDQRWEGSSWPPLMESIGFRSCWSTPIPSSAGQVIGVFALYKQTAAGPTSLEQRLVDRFVNIASLAIERTQADAALKQTSEDLQRTNRFLVETQRLTLTASFTWDVERNEHIWSEENYRIFEFDPASEITLEKIIAAVHPDDLPEVETLLAEAAGGDDFELAFRLVPASGKTKYAHVVGRRMEHIVDRPIFMGAIQDVTARKLTEEALDRARSELTHLARVSTLGALTASIAHEVNQPLSGIITNSSACLRLLAADPPDIDKARATAERTIRDGNRASEVIKRLRAMFAADPHRFEPVDLHDAVREVLALCNTEIRSGGAILRHDFMAGTPLVMGDRVQIQQVVLNLVLNALDAMSEVNDRSRSLLLSTAETEQNGVRLAVRDSGIGLDDQSADKLFDAFYTTKPHGMGVGLAISRSIIENHGGRLTAARNDGHGATFAFAMPIHERGLEREMNVITIN
jgi:PAS domain S-box-containing protein